MSNQTIGVDNNFEDSNPKSGWYKQNENNNYTQLKLENERNLSLRVRDSTINLPGIIRYNTELSKFQGYTGDLTTSTDGWTNFQSFDGINGNDGKDSITDVRGTNLKNITDSDVYGLFSNVEKTETVETVDSSTISINNMVDNIYSTPVYEYNGFGYLSTASLFDLSGKTITFTPYDNNSYTTTVRNNDIYPKIPYNNTDSSPTHTTIRVLNQKK